MFEKMTNRIKLNRIVMAKKTAIENNQFETAALLRDDEKRLLKKMGISTEQNKKNSHQMDIIERWVETLKLKIQREKLFRNLKESKKQEIDSIKKLNYNEVNLLHDQKIALYQKIERIECNIEKYKNL
jgi:ABC-type phosphate transport system auxiliary subunit